MRPQKKQAVLSLFIVLTTGIMLTSNPVFGQQPSFEPNNKPVNNKVDSAQKTNSSQEEIDKSLKEKKEDFERKQTNKEEQEKKEQQERLNNNSGEKGNPLYSNSKDQKSSFINDSLDSYIKRGMTDWQIPGLAIAIVKDGKVIFQKGYGVREIGKKDEVNENTLFIIASNSKLFTGTSIANLDYEKKLSLNDKVTKYIPWFRLYDSTSTELANVRDMLCHRLGTKTFQGDFTFWDSNLPKDSIVWKMRYLKPPGVFRQDYGYCNSAFLVAGQILEKVTGQSWENYVMQHILIPLGMGTTYMNTAGLSKMQNAAHPHNNLYSSITKVPFDNVDNLGPATSMVSNVKDLSKWLLFQLDSGRYNGQRIFPWEVLQKTRDVNIITSSRKSSIFPSHFRGYGLGLNTTDYNGRQVYWHTGGAFGYVTNVCFVPEENLGITILTNNDNQSFFEALRYQILDSYLGVPYTDRSALFLGFFNQNKKELEAELAKLEDRVNKKQKPELALDSYCGEYLNQVYGKITISKSNTLLICKFEHHPELIGYMQYMDNNEFRMTYSNIGYGIFPAKFSTKDGKVTSVEVKVNDFVENDPYLFIKK
ncbi:MAG TPA: serine hydrolase [Chitinophagaceae bacterium]|nr:serine hydrolase [Chitinophagaceae bacterium]